MARPIRALERVESARILSIAVIYSFDASVVVAIISTVKKTVIFLIFL
jgi:hypothetical protein